MWISDVSIRRPVFAVMIIMALVVLGWISLGRVGVDLFPKVEFPVVSVTTTLEGASPEAVESDVTDPIEEQVNTTSGIETLSSTSDTPCPRPQALSCSSAKDCTPRLTRFTPAARTPAALVKSKVPGSISIEIASNIGASIRI